MRTVIIKDLRKCNIPGRSHIKEMVAIPVEDLLTIQHLTLGMVVLTKTKEYYTQDPITFTD